MNGQKETNKRLRELQSRDELKVIGIEDLTNANKVNPRCWFYYITTTIIFEGKEYFLFMYKARKGTKKGIERFDLSPVNGKLLNLLK
jgi:hypothetical protein